MCILATTTIRSKVPHLNITAKLATSPVERLLAPSKEIVFRHKHYTGDMRFKDWHPPLNDQGYIQAYVQEVRGGFFSDAGRELLKMLRKEDQIVLGCFCKPGKFCHRHIAITHILVPICTEHQIPYVFIGEIE